MKAIQLLRVLGFIVPMLATSVLAQSSFGNGLAFTNSSQYVSIPNFGNIVPTNEVTVEFWANLVNPTELNPAFVLQPDQYPTNRFAGFPWYEDGSTYWEFGNINKNGALTVGRPDESIGLWIHYALVASKSGNYMAMYKNGVLVATNSGMSPFFPGTFELRIGGCSGVLNDFRVWNTARSQAQIFANYSTPLAGNESGLLVYYRLDSTNGLVATNSATATGATYNGTLMGGASWATGPRGATSPASGSTLDGIVYPGTTNANYYFQYGTTTNYGSTTVIGTANAVSNFYAAVAVSNVLTGLVTGTTYHYRLIVSNSVGNVTGQDGSFLFGVAGWTPLANVVPDNISHIMLLTDGTVLAKGSGAVWFRLAPDAQGHYVNGTWSRRADSAFSRLFMSSVVLQNGKVFTGGGEYGSGSNNIELYNPTNDTWSTAVNPTSFGNIEDGNGMLLSNGKVLIEPQGQPPLVFGGASYTYIFNPANNSLSQTAGAPLKGIGEATWVKLPNDNILIIDSGNGYSGSTSAEQYNPASDTWASASTAPDIWPDVTGSGDASEMGPAFLLPNGNAIFFGGNGVTAIYNNGTWSQGTSIPNGLGMKDAGGAMMNNGKILLAVCSQGTNSAGTDINGAPPSSFYTFDYTANGGSGGYTQVPAPGMAVALDRIANAFEFLNLPDGSILVCGFGGQCYVYSPTGSAINAGKPNIVGVSVNGDGSLHISGTLLNGISQGSSFGDNAQNDSNYPLVRFTDASGNVRYGRTYNWSSTSVMTGTNILTTECTVPSGGSLNDTIQVVANGNASDPVPLTYAQNGITWVDFNYSGGGNNGSFATPYGTMATGVSGAASGGLLDIKAGSSTETIQITKPMRIVSYGGTAHIGP